MRKKQYFWLILLFITTSAFSGNHTKHRKINWQAPEQIQIGDSISFERLAFPKASYQGTFSKVPYFSDLIRIPSDAKIRNLKLISPEYEQVSAREKNILEGQDLPTEPKITSSRLKQRSRVFMKISLTPIVKQNGNLFKLTAFDLSYEVESIDNKKQSKVADNQTSVLASGTWYKIRLAENGIYKLTYDFLDDHGVDLSGADPDKIGIFGNTGKMLPEIIGENDSHGLTENPIQIVGGEDGSFDPGDYILFFGHGPVFWEYAPLELKFRHRKNYYTEYSYYFLTTDKGTGKTLTEAEAPSGEASETVETYDNYKYHEKDMVNLIESGRIWYGEQLDQATQELELPEFEFKNVVPGSRLYLQSDIAARSTVTSRVYLEVNDKEIYHHTVSPLDVNDHRYFRPNTHRQKLDADGDNYKVQVRYPAPTSSSSVWVNWVELTARCELRYSNEQLLFRDKESAGFDQVVEFKINNAQPSLKVWDVTDPTSPRIMETSLSGNTASFKANASEIRQYIAFAGQEYLSPDFVGQVEIQNLHSVSNIDFLIVSHPDFLNQAQRLADHHQNHDDLDTYITTPQKIYNEFSSGGQDISAIRNFAHHIYTNSDSSRRLKYMMFFGNASYDYKDIQDDNTNFVPTFQGYNSSNIGRSYLTDDYFGLLDEGEGHQNGNNDNLSGLLDIGIGRLPAMTPEGAQIMVDKIIHYNESPEAFGQWRNYVCVIADDEDSNIHLRQAEQLAQIVDTGHAKINLQKIYLDAYRQESTPGGERYPEVNDAIKARMEKGALVMNYTGHGGETGLAHESIINEADVENWSNYNALPLFITATCEFSRFDDPGLISAGEKTLLNPNGGSIGLLSTTRLAFSHTNFILNKRVFLEAFKRNEETGEYPRLGDLVIASKTPMDDNLYNFVLLGDPAMKLAYPEQKVVTTSVRSEQENNGSDTLKALKKISIKGAIESYSGELQSDFNGKLTPIVFDKEYAVSTRANDPNSYETNFQVQDNILYKGQVSVTNGEFEFSFVVPKDINYSYGKGKLSYYASSDHTDASGADTSIVIGGSTNQWDVDNEGPDIEVFLNDSTFQQGDLVNPSPILKAELYDESGLNTVGNGIGHDLSAKLTGAADDMIILNDFYTANMDSYKGGTVVYPFNNLPEGEHTLTLKAWDVYNNSSEKTIRFIVSDDIQPYISTVTCYPNPFMNETQFEFKHNQYGERLEVTVRIYSLQGQLIRELGPQEMAADGYGFAPIKWNGKDQYGNRTKKGMYIYNVIITTENGNKDRRSGKLIKTN